jgi:hypothetical protein
MMQEVSSLHMKGFLINDIRHIGRVAVVVAIQNVDQSLDAAAGRQFTLCNVP